MLTVIFAGNSIADPEDAEALTVSLPFLEFKYDPAYIGRPTKDGLGAPRNLRRYKAAGVGTSAPVQRSASLTDSDYGRLMFFKEQIVTSRYIYILRVYEGDIGSAPALRADYDRADLDTATSANSMWYATAPTLDGYPDDPVQGKLPMLIEIPPDSIDVSEPEAGTYSMTMEWKSVNIYTGSKA